MMNTMKWVTQSVKRGYNAIAAIHTAIEGKAYIAGGYAAWMASSLPSPRLPSDVDIFCVGPKETVRDILRGIGARLETRRGPVLGMSYRDLKLQVIDPLPTWQVWPDDLLNSFDMDIYQAVLIDNSGCLGNYRMGADHPRIRRVGDPLYAMRRVLKYARGGIQFDSAEIERIMVAYNQDVNDLPHSPLIARIPQEERAFWLKEERASDEYESDYIE